MRIGLDLPKKSFHRRAVPVHDAVLACLKSNLARLHRVQGQCVEEAELFSLSSSSRRAVPSVGKLRSAVAFGRERAFGTAAGLAEIARSFSGPAGV